MDNDYSSAAAVRRRNGLRTAGVPNSGCPRIEIRTSTICRGSTAVAKVPAHAAPSRAASLAGVAPALVLTLELDIGRDEAEDYASALALAGVPVRVHRFDGLFHGVFNMSAFVPRVRDMHALIGEFVTTCREQITEAA